MCRFRPLTFLPASQRQGTSATRFGPTGYRGSPQQEIALPPLASPAGINMVRLISAIALAPGWRSRVSTNRRRTVDVPGSAPAALTRVGRRATDLGLPRQNGALSILEKTELRISQSMSAKSTGKPTPKRARSRGAAPAHIDCPGSFGTKPRTA